LGIRIKVQAKIHPSLHFWSCYAGEIISEHILAGREFAAKVCSPDAYADLDEWIEYYNNNRTHQGKICCGRTPMQTMIVGREIWNEKTFGLN
jgi:hypothetical protein